MSVRTMARVWEQSKQSGSALLMLLAIADFSDDSGVAYPAVSTLAEKCRMSLRNAGYVLRGLQASGELEIKDNEGPRGTNLYLVKTPATPATGCTLQAIAPPLQPTAPLTPATHCTPPATGFRLPLQPTADEPSLNQETRERERDTRAKRSKSSGDDEVGRHPDIPEQVWKDWLKVRKKKNAPLTRTAWEGIEREAEKAGMTTCAAVKLAAESNWQGFKADWVKRDGAKNGHEPMSFAERATEAKAQRIAELTGGMANAPLRTAKKEIVDVDATEIHARRLA